MHFFFLCFGRRMLVEGRRIKRDYEIKKGVIVVSMIIFCTFAPNYRNEHLGSTGFDSKWH